MAAPLTQHQFCISPSEHHHYPASPAATIFHLATAPASPRTRSRAATWIPVRTTTVRLSEDPYRPRSRNGGSRIATNKPGWSTLPLVGDNGLTLLTRMDAGGLAQGESVIQRSVRKVKETKIVIMVDPVEAKRLAAAEMRTIIARNKLKRQKEIEAINGGVAVIGLTTGIVIDGYTGKSILIQIAGYLDVVADFLTRITPP